MVLETLNVSYTSFWRTGHELDSESDPLSLRLLKPFISPESKTEKSPNCHILFNLRKRGHISKNNPCHLNNTDLTVCSVDLKAKPSSTKALNDFSTN